jgi:hypothetical protein
MSSRPQGKLYPHAAMRDLLGVGLGFPDQRLQPRLQILGRDFVEAVIDLAGID